MWKNFDRWYVSVTYITTIFLTIVYSFIYEIIVLVYITKTHKPQKPTKRKPQYWNKCASQKIRHSFFPSNIRVRHCSFVTAPDSPQTNLTLHSVQALMHYWNSQSPLFWLHQLIAKAHKRYLAFAPVEFSPVFSFVAPLDLVRYWPRMNNLLDGFAPYSLLKRWDGGFK